MNEQSSQACTSLPTSSYCSKCASLKCKVQIGIFIDYGCIVTTELKETSTESVFNCSFYQFADFSGASE